MTNLPNTLTNQDWADAFGVQITKVTQARDPWLEKLVKVAIFCLQTESPETFMRMCADAMDIANREVRAITLDKLERMNTGRLDRSSVGHGSK